MQETDNFSGFDSSESRPIVSLKLFPPKASSNIVERTRLIKKVVDLDIRVVSIVAPAGYGKTVLMTEAYLTLQEMSHKTVWIHLDEYDNGFNFWFCFVEALKRIDPTQDFSWLDKPHWKDEEFDESSQFGWLVPLINQMAFIKDPFTIFLDNLHVIKNHTIHSMLRQLFDYMPAGMRLVIATRERIPFSISHMLMRGEALVIDKDDLAFNYAETSELLKVQSGPEILTGKVWSIQQITHGWVTAVKVLGMSSEDSIGNIARSIDVTMIDNSSIFQFLEDEVMGEMETPMWEFLTEISLLTEIRAELCDYVLERSDSADILYKLENKELFVYSINTVGGWFRIHPLFRDYLRKRFADTNHSREKSQRIHARAADWFESNGYGALALPHLFAAEMYDKYLDIVEEKYCISDIRASFSSELVDPLISIPRLHLYKHPKALTLLIIILFHLGGSDELDRLIKDIGDVEQFFSSQDVLSDWDEKYEHIIRCLFAYDNKEYEIAIFEFESAISIGEGSRNDIDGFLMILSARCNMALGRSDEAIFWLRESLNKAQRFHMVEERLASTNELARTLANIGCIYEAERVLLDGLRYADSVHSPGDGVIFLEFSLMFLRREWGILEGSDNVFDDRQNFIAQQMENFTGWLQAPDFFLELSNCYKAEGCNDMASICYKITKDLLRSHLEVPFLSEQVSYSRAKHWLFIGQIDMLDAWSEAQALKSSRGNLLSDKLMLIPKTFVFLAHDKPRQLLDYLYKYLPDDRVLNLPVFRIDFFLLKAWAYARIGDSKQAYINMLNALVKAERAGFARSVIDWGPWLLALVEESTDLLPDELSGYVKNLVVLGHKVWDDVEEIPYWCQPDACVDNSLSLREMEVLKMLCESMSTPDIANKLGISLSTAKSHVNSIYRKMGVHKRVDAVKKGSKILGMS
ncbi:LuxR C-terminal-related transcriptional regulator [Adlercreutzia sp. ZJ304]|uniref:LuxR C-terminal-related transcriptional regulator n=1 Tax=Adlercreutzia sp. ZJ304 TaxID=2709791 RepID=UPI0013EC376E|nr:LuxR C-terminal-related transcriptional regulator [Adlercreutzia sp. ZJ304]